MRLRSRVSSRAFRLAVGALLFATLGGGAWGAPPPRVANADKSRPFEFRPGVIVDRARSAVYLMAPSPGIEAVELTSGATRWSTNEAAKPLLVHDDLLIAQAEPADGGQFLGIVAIRISDPTASPRRFRVGLPEGVRAAIDDGPGERFAAEARIREGALVVSWRYSRHTLSGREPRRAARGAASDAGAALIDLVTGRVSSVEDEQSRERNPGSDARSGELPSDPTPFGEGFTFRYQSADGRHLLASRHVPRPSPAAQGFSWRVHSSETGELVATFRHFLPAAWFFVAGETLVHESRPSGRLVAGAWVMERPLALRALDLGTGEERWFHPIRDTAYRGPVPSEVPKYSGP